MQIYFRGLFLIGIFGVCFATQARVFNYKDSSLAGFVRGTGGMSQVGDVAFAKSSGTDTVIDGEPQYTYSGEFGFQLGMGSLLNLRLGAELIGHETVETKGTTSAGTEYFQLESSIFMFHPNATLEYIFSSYSNTRFYFGLGVGMADVTVENKYSLTTDGATNYGLESYTEKLTGSGISTLFNLGFETLFVDNVTFSADIGYRYLKVDTLKYKGNVNSILVPTGASKGEEAFDFNGNKRSLDLSGVTAGVMFRFYFNFL